MPRGKRRGRQITHDVFAAVIRAFLTSPKFDALAQSTRSNYRRLLTLAEEPEGLGSVPVEEMRPALVQAFLDGLADQPATQKNARVALKALERWAIVRDLLPRPITLGTESIYDDDGGHMPWTDEQVAYGERHAPPHLSRVITMAANTGQRGSDLVKMRWTDIEDVDGRPGINVKQKKTGLEIWVPFTQPMIEAIGTWERSPGFILRKRDGKPWTRVELSNQWLHARDKQPALAPLKTAGLVIHGLRGTAVVRLRRGGASIPQICDMIGMSPEMVKRYCRHSDQRKNALAAVHILDRTAIERARGKRRDRGSKT
jgi:integrase